MNCRVVALVSVAPLLCTLLGCGGQPKPAGLPNLYRCQVTVTMGGKPVDGAIITFAPEAGQWSANGRTDANGVAQMKTHATYDGAPAGKFKVGVNKISVGERAKTPDGESYEEGLKAYLETVKTQKSLIPDELTTAAKSPIGVEVKAGADNKFAIELNDYLADRKK